MTDYIVSLSSVSSTKVYEKLSTKPVAEIKCILFLSLHQLDHCCNSQNLIRCSTPLPIAYFIASTSSARHQANWAGNKLSSWPCPGYQTEGEPADHRYWKRKPQGRWEPLSWLNITHKLYKGNRKGIRRRQLRSLIYSISLIMSLPFLFPSQLISHFFVFFA